MKLFYSYSHKDEKLRDKLEAHLSLLKREGLISEWHDRRITAGSEWAGEITAELNSADVILLLVSADFIASDYCWDVEVKRALERYRAGEARVIPIILRPCDWHSAPFGKLQSLPTDGKPVANWGSHDMAFADIVRGIRTALQAAEGSLKSLSKPEDPARTPEVSGHGSVRFVFPTITLGDLLVKVSVYLQHEVQTYTRLERGRKDEISRYMRKISDCVSRVAKKLSKYELPNEDCESLRVHLAYLKTVVAPIVEAGVLSPDEVERLHDELYAAIEAPIRIVSRLEKSRWHLLGSIMDGDSPVVVGKTHYEGEEIPVAVGTGEDFPERIKRLRRDLTLNINFDVEKALTEELRKIEEAAGLFRGFADVLRAV